MVMPCDDCLCPGCTLNILNTEFNVGICKITVTCFQKRSDPLPQQKGNYEYTTSWINPPNMMPTKWPTKGRAERNEVITEERYFWKMLG